MITVNIRKQRAKLQRYTLKKLLRGVTLNTMKRLKDETMWAREGKPIGREIP